jgi:nucleotide-binding universal stress UspA family protein
VFKKILVAYDDSAGSKRAFSAALQLAKSCGAELSILSVIEGLAQSAEDSMTGVDEALEHEQRHFELVQQRAIARAEQEGVKATQHIVPGQVVETVVRLAAQERVDTIVLGGLGHSRILGRASGGTGSLISSHAHCTVVIVR